MGEPRALAWESNEIGHRLTSEEVEVLFEFTKELSDLGKLNGKYQHASIALYWQRVRKGD